MDLRAVDWVAFAWLIGFIVWMLWFLDADALDRAVISWRDGM